jgi:hypothetical protein
VIEAFVHRGEGFAAFHERITRGVAAGAQGLVGRAIADDDEADRLGVVE